jgi:hypothetical protein
MEILDMENAHRGEALLKTEVEMAMMQSDKIRVDREMQRILRDIMSDPRK